MPAPLGRAIRARLLELGLSVDDLVERSKLARSTVYSVINGSRPDPRGSTLTALADALAMSTAELFDAARVSTDEDDELLQRAEEFKAGLRGIPRIYWATITRALTAAADSMANSMAETPPSTVSEADLVVDIAPQPAPNGVNTGGEPPLTCPIHVGEHVSEQDALLAAIARRTAIVTGSGVDKPRRYAVLATVNV